MKVRQQETVLCSVVCEMFARFEVQISIVCVEQKYSMVTVQGPALHSLAVQDTVLMFWAAR
jgi:hypothetical protein